MNVNKCHIKVIEWVLGRKYRLIYSQIPEDIRIAYHTTLFRGMPGMKESTAERRFREIREMYRFRVLGKDDYDHQTEEYLFEQDFPVFLKFLRSEYEELQAEKLKKKEK